MARVARADLFDPAEVSVFHCINRCVRRCFLCGDDPLTGANYDHRKVWLEERLAFLAGQFGIDVLGFSILSNHFHLILRNRPDVVGGWSDTEVATRWVMLCPVRKTAKGTPAEPTAAELDAIRNVPARLAEIRTRLSDISWFMRMIAEPIARRANREDRVNGRFWQGRFRTVKLCDEAAILACAAYVDLNPIRAGIALTPEGSNFTSVQRRVKALVQATTEQDAERENAAVGLPTESASAEGATSRRAAPPDAWLAPLPLEESSSAAGPLPSAGGLRASDKGFLPLALADYLELVEWTGRQIVRGRGGMIPAQLPPLLARLGVAQQDWLPLVTGFGRHFHRVAGAPQALARLNPRRSFHPGRAALLCGA